MKEISVSEAFSNAPPRGAAVLCKRAGDGGTDMILCEWFTWLNMKRQPMLSFSLARSAGYGLDLQLGDTFVLAFPGNRIALPYEKGIHVPAGGDAAAPDGGTAPVCVKHIAERLPALSGVILRCTLAGAYNYPFRKVRIFNADLDSALELEQKDELKALPETGNEQ